MHEEQVAIERAGCGEALDIACVAAGLTEPGVRGDLVGTEFSRQFDLSQGVLDREKLRFGQCHAPPHTLVVLRAKMRGPKLSGVVPHTLRWSEDAGSVVGLAALGILRTGRSRTRPPRRSRGTRGSPHQCARGEFMMWQWSIRVVVPAPRASR